METIPPLLEWARGVAILMVIIIVLVWFHELGHYLAARMFGMKVDAFAVMMGGVRKTDLTPLLAKPMMPSRIPWLVSLGLLLCVLAATMIKQPILGIVGLAGLALALPIWVAVRLANLYHLAPGVAAKAMAMSWLGGLGILFFATKFQNLTWLVTLGVLGTASAVGLAVLYYTPVSRKSEDSPQGHGTLQFGEVEVPVLFRPLWCTTDKNGTEFSLLLLPLGGFAQIHGMLPKEDGSESKIPGGFYSKPAWQRLIVLFAGPFFSLLFAVLSFTAIFSVQGIPQGQSNEIVAMGETMPAYVAGLRPGDKIVALDGVPVRNMFEAISHIRNRFVSIRGISVAIPIDVGYIRGKAPMQTVRVTPFLAADSPFFNQDWEEAGLPRLQAKLGISGAPIYRQLMISESFQRAVMTPFLGVKALVQIATTPKLAQENVGSVASLAGQTKEAAKDGLWPVISLAAGLSLTLGLMNLLPIVPMDGGQMVVALAEMFRRGRRLSMPVQQTLQSIGMVLIILLTVTAVTFDVRRSSQKPKTTILVKQK